MYKFQFTPLREGRPEAALMLFAVNISIHAPPRGATCTADCGSRGTQNFNSRPSARGDDFVRRRRAGLDISIHAPPRGATSENTEAMNMLEISIHAPPRGATRHRRRIAAARRNFNSRPSARGDALLRTYVYNRAISIHAPPRGATQVLSAIRGIGNYFNSRPSARGDRV